MTESKNFEEAEDRIYSQNADPLGSSAATGYRPVCIEITIGTEMRDNRLGDFYNALDELVCWFQSNTLESDEMIAKMLRLHADRTESL